ncbi:hypothetical protein [Lewinella sp. IMCC34191]|uniref:hypothetical protein n=1 Tax=Lewinella sp. IMCC34191 TaxID=2259172 RepID=UPI000E233E08|nr:hypothetical protein [Lewinella sp. IMCC34191]
MQKGTGSEKRWENLNVALENYRLYLNRKQGAELSIIDLLYISNFKGGNASITEEEASISEKLPEYDKQLNLIRDKFGNAELRDLSESSLKLLIERVEETLQLASSEKTCMRGFGPSYLSALLHVHFPDLIPILDRRILINSGRVKRDDVHRNLQIKDIASHAEKLIRWFHRELQGRPESLRDMDRLLFI